MSIASIDYAIAADDILYDSKSAARFLRCAPSTLERWRLAGIGPVYMKNPGKRGKVLYARSALVAWLAKNTYRSTSEY